MNLDEAKRVNQLSKDLLNHGMAGTPEQATLQAEEMVKRPSERIQHEKQAEKDAQATFENIVQNLSSQIREMEVTIDSMKQDYALLKAQVDQLKQQREQKPAPELAKETVIEPDRLGVSEKDVALDKIFYFGKK